MLDALGMLESTAHHPQRRHGRCDFPGAEVAMTLQSHGINETHTWLTISRNVSATGISILHCGFVYPNTPCTLAIPTLWGEVEKIEARVKRCRLVQGRVHELGIEFDHHVDTRCFVANASTDITQEPDSVECHAQGTVMLLDDQEPEHMLFKHHLRQSQLSVLGAKTTEEALRLLDSTPIHLFVCDLMLSPEDGSGLEAMRLARESGYTGPILIMTAHASADDVRTAREQGICGVLLKPYTRGKLFTVLNQHLSHADDPESDDADPESDGPIYSTLAAEEADSEELLSSYIADVQDRITSSLNEECAGDLETLRQLCQNFWESGAGFGYMPLSLAAREAQRALDATASVEESRQALMNLRDIAGRLEPAVRAA